MKGNPKGQIGEEPDEEMPEITTPISRLLAGPLAIQRGRKWLEPGHWDWLRLLSAPFSRPTPPAPSFSDATPFVVQLVLGGRLRPAPSLLPGLVDVPTLTSGLGSQAEQVERLGELLGKGEEHGAEAGGRPVVEPLLAAKDAPSSPEVTS